MSAPGRWLLLVHHIPAKPDYLRVKVARRLAKIGAVALKKTVYVLPRSDAAREDLDWVRREIAEGGGDAMVIDAALSAGVSDADVEELFRRAREADYVELAAAARALGRTLRAKRIAEDRRRQALAELSRLVRRLDEVTVIDFFEAPSREVARAALATLEERLTAPAVAREPSERPGRPVGATWVTRAGVHVDRIASAWLIRRFIDPEARFAFVAPRGYVPAPGEIRFDMDEAEHTHEGDACTFEVLCRRFELREPGLAAIAEIVHDIDLKDGAFARPETDGVAALVTGLALSHRDDTARIAAGSVMLDALLAAFARRGAWREARR